MIKINFTFAVLSWEAVATNLSFGDTQTQLMSFWCAISENSVLNVAISLLSPSKENIN
jgi:hypothetical protein